MKTEAIGFVREDAENPRQLEGIAVPYGVVSAPTELVPGGEVVRETFAPGAFAANVAAYGARQDGRRLAFRPAHGEKPVGVVTAMEDGKDGVSFRASIFEGAAGDEYLNQVRAGLNGVSIEAMWSKPPRRTKDGVVVHREAAIHAIAGSVSPAYDGAHIALRDMEDSAMADEQPTPTPAPEPTPEPTPAPEARSSERSEAQTLHRTPIVVTREQAVYGPLSENSFLRDGYRARMLGDGQAAERMSRHQAQLTDIAVLAERAGDVLSSEIVGAYPTDYMPGLLVSRILKGRPMGGFYDRVAITDGRPRIVPTVSVSTTVAVQSAEGVNPAASDFATTSATVTPLLYGAETVVSRQVLDGADPAAENMIINDMMEAYAQASETVIKTAVEAGSAASGTAITAATPYAGLIGNLIAFQAARFTPATGQFIPPALFSVALQQADTTGRSFLATNGATNALGAIGGDGAFATMLASHEYLSWASTVNVVVTGRPSDFAILESSVARFSYDQATGPAAIRIGIWAYLVVAKRAGSLKVTAA